MGPNCSAQTPDRWLQNRLVVTFYYDSFLLHSTSRCVKPKSAVRKPAHQAHRSSAQIVPARRCNRRAIPRRFFHVLRSWCCSGIRQSREVERRGFAIQVPKGLRGGTCFALTELSRGGLFITVPPRHRSYIANPSYVTVKVSELVAVPPGVVTVIFPVCAPLGTVAVICVYEFTVKVALTPPNVTLVAPVKFSPVMTTLVPGVPLVGEKLEIVGVTRNVTFTLPRFST